MDKNELAGIIAEVILNDFDAITELVESDDEAGLIDEVYEILENMD